jgi:hypothetical protein
MTQPGWLETCAQVEVDFCAKRGVEKKAAAAVGHRLAFVAEARFSPTGHPPSSTLR